MTKTIQRDFESILKKAPSYTFATCKNDHSPLPWVGDNLQHHHMPTKGEVIAHLKLLKAFQLLKIKVVGQPGDIDEEGNFIRFTERQVKYWLAYLTNASRRFIIYMSALKHKFKDKCHQKNESEQLFSYENEAISLTISTYISRVLPPLDVVMIWHSFALNPRALYDNGVRNNFLEFTMCPLPLHGISHIIDPTTFTYKPLAEIVQEFYQLTKGFGLTLEYEYHFDLNMNFSLHCPVCERVLVSRVALTNYAQTGFADRNFKTTADGLCNCTVRGTAVDHSRLRRHQLQSDMNKQVSLPRMTEESSRLLNGTASTKIKKRSILLDGPRAPTPDEFTAQYDSMNLLHLSIPTTSAGRNGGSYIEISENLVAMTIRQERFIMKMNSFDFLNSSALNQTLSESIVRYARFFKLMCDNYGERMLVPTLDIDLIWHTHLLSPVCYIQYSRAATRQNLVIGHDDNVDEETLAASFQETGNLYYQLYDEHYYYCPCSFCNETAANSRPIVKSLFGVSTAKSQPAHFNNSSSALVKIASLDTNTNASHISAHNAVRRRTNSGKENYRTVSRPFPWNIWNAENRALNQYGAYFVLEPISEEAGTGMGQRSGTKNMCPAILSSKFQ